MSSATKVAALVLMLRVLNTAFPERAQLWTVAVAVLAVASLAVGNLAALVQRRVKRMLAYSSISHAGFMLIPIAAGNAIGGRALLYYLIVYAAMSIGAFAVVAARERELGEPVTLENLAGFGWERPFLGVAMWTFMLGFAGLPLTGGFIAKFYAFSAAYERGWVWLVVVGVIATAVSLYYYFAVIRAMYMRPAEELQLAPSGGSPPPERLVHAAVAGGADRDRRVVLRRTAAHRPREGRSFLALVPVLSRSGNDATRRIGLAGATRQRARRSLPCRGRAGKR